VNFDHAGSALSGRRCSLFIDFGRTGHIPKGSSSIRGIPSLDFLLADALYESLISEDWYRVKLVQ
jgi:hypothetical protein